MSPTIDLSLEESVLLGNRTGLFWIGDAVTVYFDSSIIKSIKKIFFYSSNTNLTVENYLEPYLFLYEGIYYKYIIEKQVGRPDAYCIEVTGYLEAL
jgi:hypothetical protein